MAATTTTKRATTNTAATIVGQAFLLGTILAAGTAARAQDVPSRSPSGPAVSTKGRVGDAPPEGDDVTTPNPSPMPTPPASADPGPPPSSAVPAPPASSPPATPPAAKPPNAGAWTAAAPTIVVPDETAVPPPQARPRFSVGVAIGLSLDNSGLINARTVAVPAFQVQLGVGEGFVGFETRLFSTQASGRFHDRSVSSSQLVSIDAPADRLALDVMLTLRPFVIPSNEHARWRFRVLESITFNAGLTAENASIGVPSVVRTGFVFGGHVDFPLLAPDMSNSLSLRITARKMSARQAHAGTVAISDTALDLFGGLALAF